MWLQCSGRHNAKVITKNKKKEERTTAADWQDINIKHVTKMSRIIAESVLVPTSASTDWNFLQNGF